MEVQMLLASLIKNTTWMKILGVILIVTGVIWCITIFGIVLGWIPIWLGVLLFSSARRLDVVKEQDSASDAVVSIEKISLFFKISSIATLAYVVFFGGLLMLGAFFNVLSYVTGW